VGSLWLWVGFEDTVVDILNVNNLVQSKDNNAKGVYEMDLV
jgi:hypothetical protein